MKYLMVLFFILSFDFSQAQAVGLSSAPLMISRQVEKKLIKAQNHFNSFSTPFYLYQSKDQTAYYLKRIRFQYAPFAGIDLPFLDFKVVPFLEFRWMRKNPVGWVNYRRY